MHAIMCPCGPQLYSRTYIVRGCEVYKKYRSVLDGCMRKLDVRDIKVLRRLTSIEDSMAIRRDRLWRRWQNKTSR